MNLRQSWGSISRMRMLTKDPLPQDADEMIEVHEFPLEEAIDNVLTSKYVHTASAYALLRYIREHQK